MRKDKNRVRETEREMDGEIVYSAEKAVTMETRRYKRRERERGGVDLKE